MNNQEILNEIEKMENKLAKFKQELNKTKEEWIPKGNDGYWFYDKDEEEIDTEYWEDTYIDKTRLKNKVIFKTEAEAQRYTNYQKAKEEYSYKFSKEEWEDVETIKYFLYYSYLDKIIKIDETRMAQVMGTIHFKTKDKAQEFIDKYKDEILEFEFGIKEQE